MKRMIALVLVAVFALSLMVCDTAVPALAQTVSTAPTDLGPVLLNFLIEGATAVRGGEFTVAIRTEDNPGVISLQLSLTYDTERLELLEVAQQDFVGVTHSALDVSPLTVAWYDDTNGDNDADGVVAYLTFRVKQEADWGESYLQLSCAREYVYNTAQEHPACSVQSDYVTVVEYLAGDLNGDTHINNRDLGLLMKWINGTTVSIDERAADTNGDGTINNRDLGLLQRYLNGWDVTLAHPAPPEPEPSASDVFLEQVPDELSGQKIKMLVWWNAADEDKAKADTFKDKTGVQLTYETAAKDKYVTKLSAAVMSGNPPALAAILSEQYPLPITRGLMQPIEMTSLSGFGDVYAYDLMEQFSYNGAYYGIAMKGSYANNFAMMYFNKTMMAADVAAGTDPYSLWKQDQWNWAMWMELTDKYTDSAKGVYGTAVTNHNYWALSAGQDVVTYTRSGLTNNVRNSMLTSAWLHAWDMVHTNKVVSAATDNAYQLFVDGQVAMLGDGAYAMLSRFGGTLATDMQDDWGVVPFPSPVGMNAVSACEGSVWGFPTGVTGKKLEAAVWYLHYYLGDAYFSDTNVFPVDEGAEVMAWMWEQRMQSFNAAGVLTHGGAYTADAIAHKIINESASKAMVYVNLDAWYKPLNTQINAIVAEAD